MNIKVLERFQFEKYDLDNLFHFQVRESVRTLTEYKQHLSAHLNQERQYEDRDVDEEFIHLSKLTIYDYLSELVEHLIGDFELINVFKSFLAQIFAERIRAQLHSRRLILENVWLNSELFILQKKLARLESSVGNAEAEKEHFQYLYKMRASRKDEVKHYHMNVYLDDASASDPEENVSPNLKTVYNLTKDYLALKRYEVAEALLQENLVQVKQKNGENHEDVATIYSLLAKMYKSQSLWTEAFDNYTISLAISESITNKTDDVIGITMSNLAHVEFKRSHEKEAERWALSALKIRSKYLQNTHPEIALINNRLGQYTMALQKYKEAINYYKQSLTVYESLLDITDAIIIRTHQNLAIAYIKTKQSDQAKNMINILCKSYQQKNINRIDPEVTIFSRLNADHQLAIRDIMTEFGSYENVLSDEMIEIIIDFYSLVNHKDLAEKMKQWVDVSIKGPKAIVRQSIINLDSKEYRSTSLDKPSSSSKVASKSTGNTNVGASLMSFLKTKTKKEDSAE